MMRSKEESLIQRSIVAWWNMQFPRRIGNPLMYAIPNGGSRNEREAANLKREGVMAGVPDLELVLPKGKTVRVEVKVPERIAYGFSEETGNQTQRKKPAGKLSGVQEWMHEALQELEHPVYVVRSLDEFMEVVKKEMSTHTTV